MTEDPTPTEEVETTAPEAEPTDDTEDLGALKRAYERVKTERQEARDELRRIREDEETRAELLKEWGYEVAEDKPEEEAEDDDIEFDDPIAPVKSKLDELTKWQQEREAERMAEQIRNDLTSINEGSDWELDDFDRQQIVNTAARDPKGFDRGALERAHQAYLARLEKAAERGVERAKTPPKPPHVTQAGKAGVKTPNLDDDTERQQWMAERLADLNNT